MTASPQPSSLTDNAQRTLLELTGKTVDELWPARLRREIPVAGSAEYRAEEARLAKLAQEFVDRNTLSSPEASMELSDDCAALPDALALLTDRQRTVIIRRFGLDGAPPRTLRQIGKELGRTYEAIRQIQDKALERLRHFFEHPGGRLKSASGAETNEVGGPG
jgi:RNA polymerase nonessential primary-like sigma factor